NPHARTNPTGVDGYAEPGTGGLAVVSYVGPAPTRVRELSQAGRRPVIAFIDTGCGTHPWLPAEDSDDVAPIVRRRVASRVGVIGIEDHTTDAEVHGDQTGPLD